MLPLYAARIEDQKDEQRNNGDRGSAFNGRFVDDIVVIGSNKTEVVHVEEVPFTSEEEVMKELSAA